MSFIYSQALVAEYSAANCSDIGASALLSESLTPKPSWWHDKTMEPSRHSRFGMTYAPLTESLGADLLMWFAADSLVRTSALQETGPDWTAKGLGYGQKWQGLLAKYSPSTHSLKTAQLSLLEDLTGCCATLPRWGLMLDGELFPQPIQEPITNEKESGFWPTPSASDVQLERRSNHGEHYVTSTGSVRRKNEDGSSSNLGLPAAVKMWPTATATAYKGWSPNHNRASTDDRLDYTVERESFNSGQQTPPMRLNPDLVEWLMGWPIGHTALKPLETGRLAEWQQQHSPCFMANREAA